MPNTVLIEGHTDAKPFAGAADYSNWELSADRANAARKVMEESGLRHGQVVQIRGYADQALRLPNKPDDPTNRRISIIVRYADPPEPPAGKGKGGGKEKEGGKEGAAKDAKSTAAGDGKAAAPAVAAKPNGK
jgi:chemotaxis protein MotB